MRDFARRVTTDGLSLVRGWALSETMDGMDHELFVYDSLPDSESALAYFDYWNKALASSNVSEVPYIMDENTRVVFTGMCDSAKAQYSGYRQYWNSLMNASIVSFVDTNNVSYAVPLTSKAARFGQIMLDAPPFGPKLDWFGMKNSSDEPMWFPNGPLTARRTNMFNDVGCPNMNSSSIAPVTVDSTQNRCNNVVTITCKVKINRTLYDAGFDDYLGEFKHPLC